MTDRVAPPKVPCGSCPYRKDVPSGIWHPDEYAKLPAYDRETPFQPTSLFMCHQRDGCLCGGWLMTHDRRHLLALRIAAGRIDPAVFDYARMSRYSPLAQKPRRMACEMSSGRRRRPDARSTDWSS